MSCNSCKGFKILIENHKPDFLLEAVGSGSDEYVKSIIESVKNYPVLKNEIDLAYEQISFDVQEAGRKNPSRIHQIFKSSTKRNVESGLKKVLANNGKDLVDYLLSSSKNKAPKLPTTINKNNANTAVNIANEALDKSFLGVMTAQAYIDFLFRRAMPTEVANESLIPFAARAAKKKRFSESKIKNLGEISKPEFDPYFEQGPKPPKQKLDWHLVLDIVGTIDPFGVADGTNIILYYNDYVEALNEPFPDDIVQKQQEALLGAFGSFVGLVIPYAGDIIKWGVKSGIKITKLIADLQPLIAKLTQKISSSTGLKKKFYEGILNLLKGPPEKIITNLATSSTLKPAGIAAFKGAAQEAISKYFLDKLKQITIGSTVFQLAVFALLKTETFGPVAAYIMALPLIPAKKVIDGFVSFINSTTLTKWSSDIEQQRWLDEHPALKRMLVDFLQSKSLQNSIEELDNAFKQAEEKKAKDNIQYKKATDPWYFGTSKLENKNKSIKILVERRSLNEAFDRLFLKKALKTFSEVLEQEGKSIIKLLDDASPLYKAYFSAMKSIDDALSATIPIKTVDWVDVKEPIRLFLDNLKKQVKAKITQVNTEIDLYKKFKEKAEIQTRDGVQVYYVKAGSIPQFKANFFKSVEEVDARLAQAEKQKEVLSKRLSEVETRESQLNVKDKASRESALKKDPVPDPTLTTLEKAKKAGRAAVRDASSVPLFYLGSYIACYSVAHAAMFVTVIGWLKENFITKIFYTVMGSLGGTFGAAWLTANLSQAQGLLSKGSVVFKYFARSTGIISGCWDAVLTVLSNDFQKVTEITIAEKYNASVERLAKTENLTSEEKEEMLIALHEEGWWANIKEGLNPFISSTRGSVADSLISDYSAMSIIKDVLNLSTSFFTEPTTSLPRELVDTLKKKFFIPSNITTYVVRLAKVLENNGVKEPEMQRQIIICLLNDFISQTLQEAKKNSKTLEEFKETLTGIYLFLFGQKPSSDAAEQDIGKIIDQIEIKLKNNLEEGFNHISGLVAQFEESEVWKRISKASSLFSSSDARKYFIELKKFLEKSTTEQAQNKQDLEQKLNEYESNIQKKIDEHNKALAGNLGPGQKQYHKIHAEYYASILEKMRSSRKAIQQGKTRFEDINAPKSFSPLQNNLNCQDLYNMNKDAYEKLRFIVFGDMAQKVSTSAESVPMSTTPTPTNVEKKPQIMNPEAATDL